MRTIVLVLILLILFASSHSAAAQPSFPENYREAYENWMKATFRTTNQSFWFESVGPFAGPLAELHAIGPNITYLLIEALRREQDDDRLYRLCTLLGYLCDIDVRMGAKVDTSRVEPATGLGRSRKGRIVPQKERDRAIERPRSYLATTPVGSDSYVC